MLKRATKPLIKPVTARTTHATLLAKEFKKNQMQKKALTNQNTKLKKPLKKKNDKEILSHLRTSLNKPALPRILFEISVTTVDQKFWIKTIDTIYVIDPREGKVEKEFSLGETSYSKHLKLLGNGNIVCWAIPALHVFNSLSGQKVFLIKLTAERYVINDVTFVGKSLLAILDWFDDPRIINIFDIETKAIVKRIDVTGFAGSLGAIFGYYSPWLVMGSSEGLCLVNVITNQLTPITQNQSRLDDHLTFATDNRMVVSCDDKTDIYQFKEDGPALLRTLPIKFPSRVRLYIPEYELLFTYHRFEHALELWDISQNLTKCISKIDMSGDSKKKKECCHDHNIHLAMDNRSNIIYYSSENATTGVIQYQHIVDAKRNFTTQILDASASLDRDSVEIIRQYVMSPIRFFGNEDNKIEEQLRRPMSSILHNTFS